MRFGWDENKNRSNIAKHGISFELAKDIFNGPILHAVDTRFDYGEERNINIGSIDEILVIVVVSTNRANNLTRIISARKANKAERTRYEEALR